MKDINYYSKRILHNINLIDIFLFDFDKEQNLIKNELNFIENLKSNILEIQSRYDNKYIPQNKIINMKSHFSNKFNQKIFDKNLDIKFIYKLIEEDIIHLEILNLLTLINELINSINIYLREDVNNNFTIEIEHFESLDFEKFDNNFTKLTSPSSKKAQNLYNLLLKLKSKIISLRQDLKDNS